MWRRVTLGDWTTAGPFSFVPFCISKFPPKGKSLVHRSGFPKTSQPRGDLAEAWIRPLTFKSSPLGKPPDGGGAKDACVSGSQKVQPPLGTCQSPQHLPWGRRSLAEPPWHRVVASRLRCLPPLSPTSSRGGNPPRCVPPTCAPAPRLRPCGQALCRTKRRSTPPGAPPQSLAPVAPAPRSDGSP